MSAPIWLAALEKDIRKLPAPAKRQRRHVTISSPQSETPQYTSTSSASLTDGQTSQTTIPEGEVLGATTSETFQPPPLRAYKKKQRRSFAEVLPPTPTAEQPASKQGYWNEYDHPEDGSEDGYYVYLDPNESWGFPGQETLLKWAQSTKNLFRFSRKPEEAALLSSTADFPDNDAESEGEETDYGTFASSSATTSPPQSRRGSYFSSLFRSLKNPYHDYESLRRRTAQHDSFVALLEAQEHGREMTKLRLYATCLVAAVVIDIILGIMARTSRRKTRGVVDSAILFGTICNLLLLMVAIVSMRTRHERLGWVHQGIVILITLAAVAADVGLLIWVLAD